MLVFVHNCFFPYDVGGAEHSLLNRVKILNAEGRAACVVSILPYKNSEIISKEIDGVKVFFISLPWSMCSPYNNRGIIKKLLWHLMGRLFFNSGLKQFRDILFKLNCSKLIFINTPGIPDSWFYVEHDKYLWVADYNHVCVKGTMYKAGNRCIDTCIKCQAFTKLNTRKLKNIKSTVFISRHMKNIYQRVGFSKSPVIIRNSETFHRPSYSGEHTNALVIGFIGQVNEMKGILHLAEELNLLKKCNPSIKLLVAGKASECVTNKLLEIANFEVEMLGKVNKELFFEDIDLCVVPSLWGEPLGRVPFEAISRNKPVFVSERGGLTEIITSSNYTYDPNVKGALKAKLEIFSNKDAFERKIEFENIYTHIQKHFSTDSVKEQLLRLF
jgi:glycosyltransferase involved in cell wall biosynthesis